LATAADPRWSFPMSAHARWRASPVGRVCTHAGLHLQRPRARRDGRRGGHGRVTTAPTIPSPKIPPLLGGRSPVVPPPLLMRPQSSLRDRNQSGSSGVGAKTSPDTN
jgi:hypothetical protein